MILHCVHLQLKPEVAPEALLRVMAALDTLCGQLPGCSQFDYGPNRDFEGKSQNYPYGFVAQFETAGDVEAYAAHPRHRALGSELVDMCMGGADGILVFDLEVAA